MMESVPSLQFMTYAIAKKSAGVEKIYTQKKEFDRKKFQTNFFFERKNKFRTQNKSYEHFALNEF